MERRDHVKKQVDLLAEALAKMLSLLAGIRQQGSANIVETAATVFKQELDLNLQELITEPMPGFMDILVNNKGYTNESLDKLADILLLLAEATEDKTQFSLIFEKAETIAAYVQAKEKTFSYHRHLKMQDMKRKLE